MQKYIRPSLKLQQAHLEFPLLNPLSRKTLLSQGGQRCNKAAKVIVYGFKRFPARHNPSLGESPKAKWIPKWWGMRMGLHLGIEEGQAFGDQEWTCIWGPRRDTNLGTEDAHEFRDQEWTCIWGPRREKHLEMQGRRRLPSILPSATEEGGQGSQRKP